MKEEKEWKEQVTSLHGLQNNHPDFVKRYYFWIYSNEAGWRAMGRLEGYLTLSEVEQEMDFYINTKKRPYKITKSEIIREAQR